MPSKLKGFKDDMKIPSKLNNNSLRITNISRPKITNLNNDQVNEISEPFYQTIDSLSEVKSPKTQFNLGRNCVSLENLGYGTTVCRDDLNLYGNNLLQNYALQWQQLSNGYNYQPYMYPYYNPYGYSMYQPPVNNMYYIQGNNQSNSVQSLRTNSTDDFKKYRDVAL